MEPKTLKIKETMIWIGKSLEIMTKLALTSEHLQWKTTKSEYFINVSLIIGSLIIEGLSRSFKVMAFDPVSNKFNTYEFTAITAQHAQEWCETIISQASHNKKRYFCILVNPISGNGKGKKILSNELLPVLEFSLFTYDTFFSTHKDFITELIQRRDFSVYTDIVCLGGDGTMLQAISAVFSYQSTLIETVNFGILPVGSRNALSCELNGKNLSKAIFNLVKGISFKGDGMKVTLNNQTLIATTAVTWGLISDATNEAQHMRFFGAQRYNVVSFKKAFQKWKKYAGVISLEDSLGQLISFKSDYVFTAVSNHQVPNISNSELLMPNARINDGQLDLLFMFFTGKIKTLNMFLEMQNNGAHAKNKLLTFIKTKFVKIDPVDLMVFNVDGEIYYSNSITIQILPQFINYIGTPNYIPGNI